jgi:ribosome-binding protein aMBF1 (putative translation factor)
MSNTSWNELRERRLANPTASDAYQATKLAYALGQRVKQLREDHDWTQKQLASHAGMTQSAVARFESGGTTPTIPVLERLAAALNADLIVQVEPKPDVA